MKSARAHETVERTLYLAVASSKGRDGLLPVFQRGSHGIKVNWFGHHPSQVRSLWKAIWYTEEQANEQTSSSGETFYTAHRVMVKKAPSA